MPNPALPLAEMPSSASKRSKRARDRAKSDVEAILAAAAAGTLANLSGGPTGGASLSKAAAESGVTVATIAAIIAALATARAGVEWLEELMRPEFDTSGEEAVADAEITAAAQLEIEREREFLTNMRKRLERDIPDALKQADPVSAVNAILEREQRYMEQHDDAAAARVHATVRRGLVKRVSPEGAFWMMSPAVREHTPDCIAMAAVGWWPWSVLDAIHPPVHTGCQCDLLTKDQAIGMGYLEMDFEPMPEAEARDRAKAIQQRYGLEEAWREWPPLDKDDLMEVRWNRRYAKGTIWGGRFMPKRGGFAPRISIRDILRRLMGPDAPPVATRGNQATVSAPDPDEIRGPRAPGRQGSAEELVKLAEDAVSSVRDGLAARVAAAAARHNGKVTPFEFVTAPRNPEFPDQPTFGGERRAMPDGTSQIIMGDFEQSVIAQVAALQAAGQPVPEKLLAQAYSARRTYAHELIHNASAIDQDEYHARPDAFALEEAMTEELAHMEEIERLKAVGDVETLQWLSENPDADEARGVYLTQREGLGVVLDYARVPEDQRRALLERLSMGLSSTDERIAELAKLVSKAQGVSQERAIDIVRGALYDYGSRAGRDYSTGVFEGGTNIDGTFVAAGRQVLAPNINMVTPGLGFAEGDMVRVTNVSEPYVGKVVTAVRGEDGKPLLTLEVPNLDADGRKMGVAFRNPDPDSIEKVADAPRKQLKGNTVTGRVKVGDTVMVTQDDGSMFKGTLERIAAMTKGGEFAADIRRDDGIVQRVRDTSVRNIRRATANDRPKVPAPPKPKKQPIPGGARRVKPKDVSGPRGYDPRRHQDPRRGLLNKTQALPAGEELLVADGSIITKGKHGSVVIERPDGSRRRYATPQRMANAESEGIEKRVGPKKGMASPADGNPDERTSLAFQLDQDAALDRLEQAGMRSPGYRPEDNPEHDIDVGNALMEWVEDPNQVYSGLDALEYDVTNGRTLSGPFFRGQAVEHLAPPESGRFRGWSYDLEIAIDFARRGPEVRGSGGTRRRERTTNVSLSPDEELVISIYKADSGVGVDINDRLAEIAEEHSDSGFDEDKVAEIRAEAEEEQIWELVNDRIIGEDHYERAKQILVDEFDTDWEKREREFEKNATSGVIGGHNRPTYVMADAISILAEDEKEAFFARLDESFEPPANQDPLPGFDPPEPPASYVDSFRDYMETADENATYTIAYDEYGDIRTQDFENPYGHEREAILDNDQMDGYERIDVVIAKGQDDDTTSIRARVEDALENPDSIYRARPFSELTEPDPDELADIEAEMAGAVEETESEALAAVGMASPSRNGYQRQLTNEEVALKGMASPAGLDRLKDGEGPVEMRLRAALDAIGLDPYDVDLDALDAHAAIHEAEPKSRLEVAGQGISPCAFSRKVDYAVHVLLPEMLAEKYPRIAKQLRDTSPRWGHRTGQKPLGLARPAAGMASPGRDDGWTPPPTPPELVPLESRLLEIGGKRFVARDEPDLEKILERGYLREGDGAQLVNGTPNRCHGNAAYLWERGEADIVTGYALSEDGLWRQHSWGEKDGEIIETTSKREKYYGVRLTDEEAAQFAADNPDGYIDRGMASPSRKVNEDAMLPKGRGVEVGGTPFRPEDANDPGFSRKYRDYQRRYSEVAEVFGVESVNHTEQKGVWSGEAEPSVATDLGDVDNETALATAAVLGQHYDQEAMAVFAPDDNGPGARFAVRIPDGMSDDEVLERISRGMPEGEGASVLDGEAYFYAHDWQDGQAAAESLAEAFDSDWEGERGTFTLISDEEYGDITYEQALGERAAEAREVRARWQQEDRNRSEAANAERGASPPQEVSGPVAFTRRTEVLDNGLHEVFAAQEGSEPLGYLGVTRYGDDVWVETGETNPAYDPTGVLRALVSELTRNYPDGDVYVGEGLEGSAENLEKAGVKRAEIPEGMKSPGFPMMKRLFKVGPPPEKKKEIERSLLEKPPEPVQGIPDYEAVELTDVKAAGGSNDARIAVDANGNSWLLKAYRGDSDRVATELLANAIYRELGITVSNAGVGVNRHPQFGDQIAVAYPLIAGDIRQWATPNPELGEGFVADALLANWDVIGLTQDNVLWNGDTPIRLDQGGTLAFRARGETKSFGPVPSEMWTMRDERGQANGTMDITEAGMIAQARDIALRLTPERIDELVDAAPFEDEKMREEVRTALKERVAWLDRYSRGLEKMPEPLEAEEVLDFFADRDANLETMPSEDAAIEAYFGDLGPEVDKHLQSGRPKEAASEEVRQAVTELDMILGIDETKLDEAIIVHVPLPPVQDPEKLVGNWVTERSFLPAQLDAPMSGTSVRLKVPSGTNAVMPAALDIPIEDADILLPRNSRVKITGVTETESGALVLDAVLKPAPAYKPAKPLGNAPIAKPAPQPTLPDIPPEPPTPPPPKGMASPGVDRGKLIEDRVEETLRVWRPEAEATATEIVEGRLADNPMLDTETHFGDIDGTYRPERTVLHKQQLDFIRGDSEPVPEGETPKAIFMSGGSAAGKGTLLGEGVIEQPDDIVHTDADEFKELIPEYQVLKEMGEDEDIEGVDIADAAPIVHEESSYLSKVAAADALATRRNLLVDAVGGSASYMRRIEEARDAGHDVEVNLVINDPDRAFEQAAKRAEETGRSVPLFAIYGSHRNVSRTFADRWQDEDADGNPVGEPHEPLIARGVPGKIYDGRTRELVATWDADGNITVLDQEAYDEWREIGQRPHPAKDPEMPARNKRAQELLKKAKARRAAQREAEAKQQEAQAYDETVGVA